MDAPLERFHPIVMHSVLQCTRRYDPGLYDSICRRFSLDADRILGLFKEVEEVGSGQLADVLAALRPHSAYSSIVFLAGRNSMLGWSEANHITLNHRGGAERFTELTRKYLPDFLGRASFNQMTRGSMVYVEVKDSVFARGAVDDHPVCGFYSGWLSELGSGCQQRTCAVSEVRCSAVDNAPSCMFAVPF